MAADTGLVRDVRAALAARADPDRAPAMQAYMKSELPFLGVTKTQRVAALRPVWAAHPTSGREAWEASVRALWDEARYREERYAALALLQRGRAWQDPAVVPLLEHLVVTGAWWDLVDEVANRTVAPLVRAHHDALAPVVRRWAAADDLWLRRAAILSQLQARQALDRDLLADALEPSLLSREFFLRKAIGWALRDASGTDPAWVRAYVAGHPQLSPLSRREALRRIDSPAG